jgi:cob(I)alamin adenosyltransferase
LNLTLRQPIRWRHVKNTEADTRLWSVGELAEAAGVTVRALHHYDHRALLEPSERSAGGHRRYSEADVARLYRILALRDLGFGLDEIASLLSGDKATAPAEVTRLHLERVTGQLEQAARLRQRLSRLQTVLERSDEPSAELIIDAMQAMTSTVSVDRIVTKLGDSGETLLGDMTLASKHHPRVEAGGTVDELNAHLGALLAGGELPDPYSTWLRRVQNELFDLGADISVPPPGESDADGEEHVERVADAYVERLEQNCERANLDVEPLDSFVLPGGTPVVAQLHVCRTVCRRAERRTVEIADVNPVVVRYLNRLSDLLFIIGRALSGGSEPLWEPGRQG